jgi:hypothetical protein
MQKLADLTATALRDKVFPTCIQETVSIRVNKTRGKGLKGNHNGGPIEPTFVPPHNSADCNKSDVIIKVWPYDPVDMVCVRYHNCRQGSHKIDKFWFLKLARLDSGPGSLRNLKGMHVESVHLSREAVLYSFYRRVLLVNWLLFSSAKLSRSKGHDEWSGDKGMNVRTGTGPS